MKIKLSKGLHGNYLVQDRLGISLKELQYLFDFVTSQSYSQGTFLVISSSLTNHLGEEERALINAQAFEQIIIIGNPNKKNKLSGTQLVFEDETELLSSGLLDSLNNKFILLKGLKQFSFESIFKTFSKRSHKTELLIDLDKVFDNIEKFKSSLKVETKLMVMVKAFAYGAGAIEVSKWLQHKMVDYLAVAFVDEGIELRENGITLPIMVMSPGEHDAALLSKYELEPEIYSLGQLKHYLSSLRMTAQKMPIHIMINTGMNRLGFDKSQIDELINTLKTSKEVEVESIMTHLAASGDPKEVAFTHLQHEEFLVLAGKMQKQLQISPLLHILNSAGITNFPAFQLNMVRLGIGMHGVRSYKGGDLTHPATFKSTITQIREVSEGATIGYGRLGKALRPLTIATIPVGYADGYSRALGNGKAYVLVNGKKAWTIGSICMDMTMIDITGIESEVNDEVILFGQDPTIEQLATWSNTIPYEVLTSISSRVQRTFYIN